MLCIAVCMAHVHVHFHVELHMVTVASWHLLYLTFTFQFIYPAWFMDWLGLVYLFIHSVTHVTLDMSITDYNLYITTQIIIYGDLPNII
jgi:hypothetical protein